MNHFTFNTHITCHLLPLMHIDIGVVEGREKVSEAKG